MDQGKPAERGASGGDAGRVRCLYCGANNFPSSPSCWQCGRPLRAAKSTPSVSAPAPHSSPGSGGAGTAPLPYPTASMPLAPPVNPALAVKAAGALGLLFPYVGLPVGIVFLMLDDGRKAQLGWIAIGWSVLGSIANGIALALTLGPLWGVLRAMAPHGVPGGGGGIPGVPDLNGAGGGPEVLLPLLHFLR